MGPYEILALLGAGGMGEVYKARDTRLNRFVAIKILPAERLTDDRRKQRFIQEAQAASALNHPNIISIYDIAVDQHRDYMVMEYVPGKTLDAMIPRTGMRLAELLKIAVSIAEGLSAAHAAGIIHRDLKPSNIMVSESGLVKILDFGLAKLTEQIETTEEEATRTLNAKTHAGTVLGTAAYMSPEQAGAKAVDVRSDIFSFGAVLYEMATGRRAFPGDAMAAMSAVVNQDPKPLNAAGTEFPTEFERIVMRCLRKDPEKRQQHMKDVKVLLQELKEESESGKLMPASKVSRRKWPLLGVATALILAGAGFVYWVARDRGQEPPRVTPLTTLAGREDSPSFSPDGNQVVFAWNGEKEDNWDLYVKMIGSPTSLRLTTDPADDQYPAWSPDGRQIAFVKRGSHAGVYWVSPLGGAEQKIADFAAAAGAPTWSHDTKFVVAAQARGEHNKEAGDGALFLIPVQGGEPRPLLVPENGRWYQYPAFAPDGRSLAFVSCGGSATATYCDISVTQVREDMSLQGPPRLLRTVVAFITGLTWAPDGRSVIYGASAASDTNTYLWRLDSTRDGELRRLEIGGQGASSPSVAPKGNRLAFTRLTSDQDVWSVHIGEGPKPLLVSTAHDSNAQFSPDGRRIVFASGRAGDGLAIWLAHADGSAVAQLTHGPEDRAGSPWWSPDGRWIVFDALGKEGRWSLKVVESSGGRPRQLTGRDSSSHVPRWSHDGKWIYFASDRTGRSEI